MPIIAADEADRCWMSPSEVCDLAIIGEPSKPEVRRFLNNVGDRGFIPFVKSGEAKTSPKLYSCISAICLRSFREITTSGRTYEFAAPIIDHVASLARQFITECDNLDQLDTGMIVLYSSGRGGIATDIRTVRSATFSSADLRGSKNYGIFLAGSVIRDVLRHYQNLRRD